MITQDLSREPSSSSSPGEIHVSLCYHPSADRFTLTVLQARNIKVTPHLDGNFVLLVLKEKKDILICFFVFLYLFTYVVAGREPLNAFRARFMCNDKHGRFVIRNISVSTQAPNSATPDTYVRLTLFNQTRAVKTKRTAIIRRSAEPCYNESFHFRLETTAVDSTNIVLAIHQPDNKGIMKVYLNVSAPFFLLEIKKKCAKLCLVTLL